MKLWLVFMCGPNSLDNLVELIEPIKQYFDGIVCVLHDGRGSAEEQYLETVKGEGEIIHLKYVKRHDFSRQHYLYCGPIQNGDWCVQIDDKERLNPEFATIIRQLVAALKNQGINGVWYYGKPFIFEYHESLQYSGNPHEGLRRLDGQMKNIELSSTYPIETDVRYSVRNRERDKYHFVGHYFKYYLFPWGSNQNLLGAEHRGDPIKVYQEREILREQFRQFLKTRGIGWDVEEIKKYWKLSPLDDGMKKFINSEKILQDAYRYFILDDLTVKDEHDWTSMKEIV